MKNNKVLVEIHDIKYNILLETLIKYHINYNDLTINKTTISCILDIKDIDKLKTLIKKEIIIKKYLGTFGIKKFIKKNIIVFSSCLISYLLLILLSNTIFNVDIICSSDVTRELIKEELNTLGIKKYSFKKSYKKLNNIKKILLENNKEKLQWIEIVEKGTTYIIEITPRDIEENKNKTQQNKNIVAKKDALITHLVVEEGDALKTIGEYVHKGEIIVSGNIMNNETLKKQVNAKAKVMGEVWYTSTTKVPYTFNEYVKQNKKVNEYHMTFFSKDIVLLGLYKTDNAFIKKTTILDKPYLFFKLYKEEKELYLYKTYNLKEDEALKEALRRSDEAIKLKLKKDEYIIDKKVLKIRNFSSRIEIEVFYRVNEDISLSLDIEDL